VRIDPNAWLLTLPAALALIQLALQPADHVVKRICREAVRLEMSAWQQLAGGGGVKASDAAPPGERLARVSATCQRLAFRAAVAALLVTSLASLAAFVGALPAA